MVKTKIFLKYIVIVFLGVCLGYLIGKYRYEIKGYLVPRAKDGFRYLGAVGNRDIYALNFEIKGQPIRNNFALKINDNYIYWESDSNSDGLVDSIMHFENGVLIYESKDINFDGRLNRKMVESYKEDGSHHVCMVDLNADNEFDLRIINPDGDNPIVEIFVKNQWEKRVKQESQYGIYDAVGNFLPVKFDNGQWEIGKK
ncbi:MAG: hypothetical protein KAQ99_03435 [Candidatus Aureabacteria bacterium]|nr:hypothetical protein [Candidatus Auribacterota bacterium]